MHHTSTFSHIMFQAAMERFHLESKLKLLLFSGFAFVSSNWKLISVCHLLTLTSSTGQVEICHLSGQGLTNSIRRRRSLKIKVISILIINASHLFVKEFPWVKKGERTCGLESSMSPFLNFLYVLGEVLFQEISKYKILTANK